MNNEKRIAILTGGGDCPGLNAVIRAITQKAILEHNMEVIGVEDGFEGLILNKYRDIKIDDVSLIHTLGGTILGTSNSANPYRYCVKEGEIVSCADVSKEVIAYFKKMNISCLVCIGGDGTLHIANQLFLEGIPIIGVPKTIDNDIQGTDITFGFDTAVQIATEGIDRIHTTAQSHHRVMIIELMGRRAGWISLYAGIAGAADIILIPEIPYDIDLIVRKLQEKGKTGKRFSIVIVAEGARPKEGDVVVNKIVEESTDPIRLGGIGFLLRDQIEKKTNLEVRAVAMGHLQRGGTPSSFDRILSTQLGTKVVEMIIKKNFGYMVGVTCNSLVKVPLKKVAKGQRLVPLNHPLIQSARSIGTSFGD